MQYCVWLDRWLDEYVAVDSKIKTVVRYEEIIRVHIKPELGNMDMNELTADRLQSFVSRLMKTGNSVTGGPLSSSSVNGVISVLKKSLYDAYRLSLADKYVANVIRRPKTTEKLVSCFSLEEQRKIEGYVLSGKDLSMLGVVVCLYTGLRIGELLALEWSDVNLEAGMISVSRTRHEGRDADGNFRMIVDTPKTRSSVRFIPIPDRLRPVLLKMKEGSTCSFVVSVCGRAPYMRTYQRKFSTVLKRAGVPYRNFHSLRHTFATRALECGMDVKTLSEILGHKSSVITLMRYAHSMTEHKKNMMNLVGSLLSDSLPDPTQNP
ncbi:MAG: site-specific integrase [Clostridia bacterium]|nr:site-specific integrase [Clostridia bacterium]